MQLIISVKQLGRKQPLIGRQTITIADIGTAPTLRALIDAVVDQQVDAYNARPFEQQLLPFLGPAEIETQSQSGRVGFNTRYNENQADPKKAKEIAIQALQDGLFVVFLNEEEFTEPEQPLSLTPDTVVTFIRLSFLAGGYY